MKAKFLFIILIIGILFLFFHTTPSCISSGSGKKIQNALHKAGVRVKLCQNAIFLLEDPIVFTKPFQGIFTEGYPTDDRRALLKITNRNHSLAINAYNKNGVTIHNIRVDGNRRELGQLKSHGLILMGGTISGQEIKNVDAFDSRSWTTLHVNWGDFFIDKKGNKRNTCNHVKVMDNTFGPSGEEEEGKWSDGISVQCEGSIVEHNTITDVTDGGIVIFGAPYSQIRNNRIQAIKGSLMVGIALVDYVNYRGNYTGVVVSNNEIVAENAFVRVGIAMGSRLWQCPEEKFDMLNHGATVKDNLLRGNYFGYGYVINGVYEWSVLNNKSEATYRGIPSTGCGRKSSLPASFLLQKEYARGTFQEEFKNGVLEKIYDITPLTPTGY